MLGDLLGPELRELLEQRKFAQVRALLAELEPADLAELLLDLTHEERAVVFRILPRELAAEAFEWMPIAGQEELIKGLSEEKIADLVNAMAADDRTALLEEAPAEVTKRILAMLSPKELVIARSLLGYPEESVGRLMTPDYLAVKSAWTVGQALEHIRAHGRDSETLNVIYVVGDKGRLIDDLNIRQILLASPEAPLEDIMNLQFVALRATDDQETAVNMFRKYNRSALPVVDRDDALLGIITIDDILHVAEEEATEDIQKIGGMQALDLPYLATSIPLLLRKRAGWLALLFIGEMFTATAMSFYEHEIAKAVVLALFVPLIISSGGNSGSQAASLVIRALALGELTPKEWKLILGREAVIGFALGALLGSIGFLRIAIWTYFGGMYGPHWVMVGLTVWASVIGVTLWGALAGSLMPLALKRIGLDPAVSSAPLVATLVDVTGLVIYFTIAAFILKGTLL